MMYVIEEFVKEKEPNTTWVFKIRPNGEKVWVNEYDKIVTYQYPYLKDLEKKVDEFREEFGLTKAIGKIKRTGVLEHILLDFRNGSKHVENCKKKVFRVRRNLIKIGF